MFSLSKGKMLITYELILSKNLTQAQDIIQSINFLYIITWDIVANYALLSFNLELSSKLHDLMYAYQDLKNQLLLPTRIVRWVHLRLDRWLRTHHPPSANLPAPDLNVLLEKSRMKSNGSRKFWSIIWHSEELEPLD